MEIKIKNFGTILVSRPDGREAFFTIRSYFKTESDTIFLDFEGVEVVAPSWLDEVLTALEQEFKTKKIELINADNVTIQEALKVMGR